MHDADGVRRRQPSACRDEHVQYLAPRSLLLCQPISQIDAFDQLHDDEHVALAGLVGSVARSEIGSVHANVVDGDHVGVGELGNRLRFS